MRIPADSNGKRDATQLCLDVRLWRVPTRLEMQCFHKNIIKRAKGRKPRKRPSTLAVRSSLSPVDVYCYLKARFGEPNGFQNFLRKDDSDNWIHWDFNLKAGEEDVYICGTSREIHFTLSLKMTDENWHQLISAIKRDFERVAKEKSAILKSLEKWVIFPNKFVDIAEVCADLHSDIVNNAGGFRTYMTPSKRRRREWETTLRKLLDRSTKVHRSSLQLSLLTPILAEAFINMTILILCKKEVRNNKRQFESFIRSNIDTKLFDLAYKCEGFARPIDHNDDAFKNFKRVMDKRNHSIHGNCDPEKEQIETVYFEGTRPLFKESGDHIGKFLELRERQYQPESAIKDYEDTYAFLAGIANRLEPSLAEAFRRIIETNYPGYDIGRKKMGLLFPDYIAWAGMQGMRYDDELAQNNCGAAQQLD